MSMRTYVVGLGSRPRGTTAWASQYWRSYDGEPFQTKPSSCVSPTQRTSSLFWRAVPAWCSWTRS